MDIVDGLGDERGHGKLHDLGVGLVGRCEGNGVEAHHLFQLRLEDPLVGRTGEEAMRSESVHATCCGQDVYV